jgi:two-component system, chemotaxis family, chemotaxis protein CheY
MRILIGEDDTISRKFVYRFLSQYGDCDLTLDGFEVRDAVLMALQEQNLYDLICLDIMMPKLDGITALKMIRDMEKKCEIERPAKVIMISAITDKNFIKRSFASGCDEYITKPIAITRFIEVLNSFGFIQRTDKSKDNRV